MMEIDGFVVPPLQPGEERTVARQSAVAGGQQQRLARFGWQDGTAIKLDEWAGDLLCDSGFAEHGTEGHCVAASLPGACVGDVPVDSVALSSGYHRQWTGSSYDLPETTAYAFDSSACAVACINGTQRAGDACVPEGYSVAAFTAWDGPDELAPCAGTVEQQRTVESCVDNLGRAVSSALCADDAGLRRSVASPAGSSACLAEALPANATGGTQACAAGSAERAACSGYACASGYAPGAEGCVAEGCDAQTVDGYSVAALAHGASLSVSRTEAVAHGSWSYTASATCSFGAIGLSQTAATGTCDSGYEPQDGACLPRGCAARTVSGYAAPVLVHSATATVTKDVWYSASERNRYSATATCTFGNTAISNEAFVARVCAPGYQRVGNGCTMV